MGLRTSSSQCPSFCSDFSVSNSLFSVLKGTKVREISREKIVYTRHCYHGYVSQVERIEISTDQERTDLSTVLF